MIEAQGIIIAAQIVIETPINHSFGNRQTVHLFIYLLYQYKDSLDNISLF